jgi:hypothetical protein
MKRKVKALFEFDGEEAFSGEMCLKVNGCRFGEAEIPCNYAVMLLDEDHEGEAHRLLQELTELTKADWLETASSTRHAERASARLGKWLKNSELRRRTGNPDSTWIPTETGI